MGASAGLERDGQGVVAIRALVAGFGDGLKQVQRIARIGGMVMAVEPRPPKFIVSGGIQHSPSALQRLADVLGQPVYPNDEMEASIRGAAIYALEKLGHPAPAFVLPTAVKPRARYAKLYATARERQRTLEGLSTVS